MVTILLEQIIEILKGWLSSFTSWAEDTAEKLGLIEEATEYIDDIYDETTQIQSAASSIAVSNSMIQGYSLIISNKASNIDSNVTAIKNNVGSIATSAGTAAAFAEDCATNTLNMDNRLVTIGSDTTQIRADSTSLAADVAEIKDTLGLYLYNTIVTEDAEGDIASCDTDLKDYLQEAKVTISADAGGITGINLTQCGANLWDEVWETGDIDYNGNNVADSSSIRSKNFIQIPPNTSFYCVGPSSYGRARYYDKNMNYLGSADKNGLSYVGNSVRTMPPYAYYLRFAFNVLSGEGISVNYPSTDTNYHAYESVTYPITFTSITDGAEIDLLTGLIKINTSPVTYDSITPIAIRTYKGVNNIYSDIGTTAVTYRETLKHYLKKQEA